MKLPSVMVLIYYTQQNKDFAITTYGEGPISNPLLLLDGWTEFHETSGIVHYMMPYCTSYFNFFSAWFWGVPEQNNNFAITTYGGGGPISNPLLLLDRWTEFHETFRNCSLHDAILHLLF